MNLPSKQKIFFLLLGAALLVFGVFAWNNLRGIGPALNPPPADIVELIEKPIVEGKDLTIRPAENLTGFPLKLPEGFSIAIFAKELKTPRVIAFDDEGHMLVSIPSLGKVVALPDENNDGKADRTITVIENLNRPHGIYSFSGMDREYLYVAESHQVTLYNYDSKRMKVEPLTPEADLGELGKIVDLPGGGSHYSRTIFPNADGLLVSIGSSCNACIEKDWRRAAIIESGNYQNQKKEPGLFATGLRNAVFLARHPLTGEIWVTEMGRDLLGDDLPPDEINILKEGADYGWPYCYGKNIEDTTFNGGDKLNNPCLEKTPSHIDLPAHSAPLGLAFIPEKGWPEDYAHDVLVAFHGSWNRSEPTGYKIARLKLDPKGNYEGMEDFIHGWLAEDGSALGRPVDINIRPDGTMYVSDDKAGVIYKISYTKP